MYRHRRITSSVDFRKAREEGQAFRNHRLVILITPNSLGLSRFGFVTSKRLGNAVVRNHVRRLLKEAARQLSAQVTEGFDIVIIATGKAVGATYEQMYKSTENVLRTAGLLRD